MSVDCPRLAAAQRTAAGKRGPRRPRRRTLVASWILIVTALSCFSFSVVAGARTFAKPDYEAAANKLPAGKQLVVVQTSDDSFVDRFTKAYSNGLLCTVDDGQVAVLAAHYEVGRITITVNGKAVPVATVAGKNAGERELKTYLGNPTMSCTIVRSKSVFFLPFDVSVS
jgi:hypothetical protein